jgi:hypothetical protein
MQQFSILLSRRLFTARVSGVFPPIIRSSKTAVASSGSTYFYNRYCIVNLRLKRDKEVRFCKIYSYH